MPMERLSRGKTIISLVLGVLLAFGAALPTYAKTVKTKKTVAPLNVQGFRIGMTVGEVKQLLQKKKIRGYETGFSDILVYSPTPGTDIRLLMTCSAKGYLLEKVELTTSFTSEETELAVPKLKEKLIAKYGMPPVTGSQGELLDFCWGKCEQDAGGVKLTATTATAQGNKSILSLTLGNDELVRACSELRPKKINSWLYQWMDAMQKIKLGMPLKDVEKLYQKRYQNELQLDEEQDEASQQYAVTNYVVKDYDFFTTLDYESQTFEGVEPGAIVLKFTGDQAGKGGALNKKLYYASFSTTKFTDQISTRTSTRSSINSSRSMERQPKSSHSLTASRPDGSRTQNKGP